MGVISNVDVDASIDNDIFGNSVPCKCHELDSPEQQPNGDICNYALRTDSAAKGAEEQSTLERATMQLLTERRVCAVVHGSACILRRVPPDDQIG
jgi:hypothetical protein